MKPMKPKILVIARNFYTPFNNKGHVGGGAISNYILLDLLKEFFDIYVLTDNIDLPLGTSRRNGFIFYNIKPKTFINRGVINRISSERVFKEYLSKLIPAIRPNIIMSQTNLISLCVNISLKYNIKSAVWIRAYENFYNTALSGRLFSLKNINYSIEKAIYKKSDYNAMRNADLVLVNSKYMKTITDDYFGVNSNIVYPPIDKHDVGNNNSQKRNNIGFIKPEIKKGLNIVLEIAKRLPEINFICFGKKPHNHKVISEQIKNIYFKGWVENSDAIFKSIKLLLVPSVWDEPFGRVVVESLNSGVLPIVSSKGGIPEAVGNRELIIDNIYDIDGWVTSIKKFMYSNEVYARYIEKGKEHTEQYAPNTQADILKDHLYNLLGLG